MALKILKSNNSQKIKTRDIDGENIYNLWNSTKVMKKSH